MFNTSTGEPMRYRVMPGIIMILISLLAACQPGVTVTPSDEDVVQWNKDPYAVLFRAEIIGGDTADAFYMLNDIPACTIYGDGRVVWVVEDSGGPRQVLFDYMPQPDIANFVVELGIRRKFYDFKEGYPLLIPSSTKPVYERLTLENNGVKYASDSFSEWPFDYYNQSLQLCIAQAKTPRTFEPDGAWISAQQTEYDARTPSIFWDSEAAGLSFLNLASTKERRWLEGSLVKILWHALQDNGMSVQFGEADNYYQIALQIPGVTRDAPPAPSTQPAS
jgi:hypothetical protein